jgi:hypothetical protein
MPTDQGNNTQNSTHASLPSDSIVTVDTRQVLGDVSIAADNAECAAVHEHDQDGKHALEDNAQSVLERLGPHSPRACHLATPRVQHFELINFPDAQRLNRMRRESGAQDHTLSGASRLQPVRTSSRTHSSGLLAKPPATIELRQAARLSEDFTVNFSTLELVSPHSTSSPRDIQMEAVSRFSPASTARLLLSSSSVVPSIAHGSRYHEGVTPVLQVDRQFRGRLDARPRRRWSYHLGDVPVDQAVLMVGAEMKKRAKVFFFIMVALNIVPFIGIGITKGIFNPCLSWATHGTIREPTSLQKRVLVWIFWITSFIWTGGSVAIIAALVPHGKRG